MSDKELIELMAQKNGYEIVDTKLREEIAELQLAFARFDFASVLKIDASSQKMTYLLNNIIEEFVDVEIMMSQLKCFIKKDIYDLMRQKKIENLKRLINADV